MFKFWFITFHKVEYRKSKFTMSTTVKMRCLIKLMDYRLFKAISARCQAHHIFSEDIRRKQKFSLFVCVVLWLKHASEFTQW